MEWECTPQRSRKRVALQRQGAGMTWERVCASPAVTCLAARRTVALRAVLEAAELRWLCVLGTGILSGEVAV